MSNQHPESDKNVINNFMPTTAETASTGGIVTSEGATHEFMSMEVPTAMPKAPRSPRPKPMPKREAPKPKRDKQKKMMPVHESPRKHPNTQAQRKEKKTTQEKGKVVELDAEEGAKDIDIEGVDPILKLLEQIPPCQGKVEVPKDPNEG